MTLEQLLQCSATELEAMTDEQLAEHFKPVLCVTRPEQQPKQAPKVMGMAIDPKMAQAALIAKSHGITLDLSVLKPLKGMKRK